LVLLDHHDGAIRPPVLELLTAVRALGVSVQGVWFGAGLESARPALQEAGVERIYQIALAATGAPIDAHLASVATDAHLASVAADVLADLASEQHASILLLASTFQNKEVAARVGVRTGAGVVVDAGGISVDGGRVVADKTVLAGTWDTRCAITTPLAVVALKANSVPALPAEVPTFAEVVPVTPPLRGQTPVVLVERAERPSARPALSEAQVVVAGGRGTMGDFDALEDLADLLGGAVGATRVATDEGWISHDAQIGQTGTTIAPRLYIGAGISGAVHHRGGMQASGTIVAVNSDPESPIFEIADYGIVGDLSVVLPQLTAEIRRLKG